MSILSLKSILLYQLGAVLSRNYEENTVCFTEFLQNQLNNVDAVSKTTAGQSIKWRKIPLQRKQNIDYILYTSALPQVLAAFGQANAVSAPSAICNQLVKTLDQSRSNLKLKVTNRPGVSSPQASLAVTKLWLEFEIETYKSGWIAFRLTPPGVVQWLDCLQAIGSPAIKSVFALKSPGLAEATPRLSPDIDAQTVRLLWQVQYAHACCCRLLRSRQMLVKLSGASPSTPSAQAQCAEWPEEWPEERSDNPFIKQTLQEQALQEQTLQEQKLLHFLIDTADDLFWIPYRWPAQKYLLLLKRSALLCQAFEDFHRSCPGSFEGDSAIANPPPKARLSHQFALIYATKNLLKVLLEQHFQVRAPDKL